MKSLHFTGLVELFLQECQVSEASKKTYWYSLKSFYGWFNDKGFQYSELTKVDLIKWKNELEETKTSLTVSNYLIIVKMFYKWMALNDFGKNIADIIKIPSKYKGFRKFPLSLKQVISLLESVNQETLKGKRDFALLNLLLRNGLRLIEAQRINIEDITLINEKHIIYLQRKGSKDKSDLIVLSNKTLESIHNYLELRPYLKETSPLFISLSRNNYGGHMNTKSMSQLVKAYLKKIGLIDKHYTAHSLRHTAGVMALKNKAGEYATQIYLNHSSFATTQLYTRGIENELLLENNPALMTDKIY